MGLGLMLVILLVLIVLGVPIALCLALTSAAYLLVNGLTLAQMVQGLAVSVNSFTLLAAPFYILVGELMNQGGVTDRLFGFVKTAAGRTRGALAHANVLASMIFAGMSGAAVADAAGLGRVEIKAMQDDGYDTDFAVAVTGASATIGPIIPPSIIMVVIGVAAGTSIGKLFIGGIIPGIVMGVAMMVMIAIISFKRKYPKGEKATLRTLGRSFLRAFPSLITPAIIIGGILGGVFTPTEAGVIAVIYAAFLGLVVHREIRLKDLARILLNSVLTSAKILFIVSAAGAFGWVLAYEQVPQKITALISAYVGSPPVFLLIVMLLYMFLGCIMDAASIVVITVPVLVPSLALLHINLVHFGVLTAIAMSLGTLTPPVATVMYILMDISKISIERYTKAILPFLLLLFGVIILLILLPQVVLWLPSMLFR
jgi:tripartite ATP-independent transporter DctM subunit